jgi:hypothetical protein
MLKVGKLYHCEEYHLLLFPDPDTAAAAAAATAAAGAGAAARAAYWSKRFGKPVSYADKNIPILALYNKEEYVEVLAGDKTGWIIYKDYLNIKEIDYGTS